MRTGIGMTGAVLLLAGSLSLAQASRGSVVGTVIDELTSLPVPGALVSLTGGGSGGGSALTSASGSFRIDNVIPSPNYYLVIRKAGYQDWGVALLGGSVSDSRVRVTAGSPTGLGQLILRPLAFLSGRVEYEDGAPAASVYVRVLGRVPIAGRQQLVGGPVVRTDDQGAFVVAALPPGEYIVCVPSVQSTIPSSLNEGATAVAEANQLVAGTAAAGVGYGDDRLVLNSYPVPSGPGDTYGEMCYPSSDSPETAQRFVLNIGERRDIGSIRLVPGQGRRIKGTVSGAVRGGDVLRLARYGARESGYLGYQAVTVVRTDGSFSFVNVPQGDYFIELADSSPEYVLTVKAPGQGLPERAASGLAVGRTVSAAPPGVRLTGTPTRERFAESVLIRVGTEDVTGVDVRLRPCITLIGDLVDGAPPNARLRVTAEPASALARFSVPFPEPVLEGRTRFTISGLVATKYFIRVYADKPVLATSITCNGQDLTRTPLDLSVSPPCALRVAVLVGGPAVAGTVYRADGSPAANSVVVIFPRARELWLDYGFNPPWLRSVQATREGTYRIEALQPGEYYVAAVDAEKRDFWRDSGYLQQLAGAAASITMRPDVGTINLNLSEVKR